MIAIAQWLYRAILSNVMYVLSVATMYINQYTTEMQYTLKLTG